MMMMKVLAFKSYVNATVTKQHTVLSEVPCRPIKQNKRSRYKPTEQQPKFWQNPKIFNKNQSLQKWWWKTRYLHIKFEPDFYL